MRLCARVGKTKRNRQASAGWARGKPEEKQLLGKASFQCRSSFRPERGAPHWAEHRKKQQCGAAGAVQKGLRWWGARNILLRGEWACDSSTVHGGKSTVDTPEFGVPPLNVSVRRPAQEFFYIDVPEFFLPHNTPNGDRSGGACRPHPLLCVVCEGSGPPPPPGPAEGHDRTSGDYRFFLRIALPYVTGHLTVIQASGSTALGTRKQHPHG
eukprot:gene23524-biopygen5831